jgi:hypothetical protein
MIRKVLLALGTAAALAISVPTVAGAAPHGHFGGGHFGGGHFGGGHFGGGGLSFGFGIGAPYSYGYGYGYGYGCSELRRVWTPYGLRWHRVWVC